MVNIETKQEVKEEIKQEEPMGNGHEVKALEPELAHKIVEQVEYYFGDINLPKDKFLNDEMKKDNGWIPLETMLKFNRLAKLTDDPAVIANALQDSYLVHVSDDGKKIRRNPEVPLPENSLEYWQEVKNRTVYVKGFPQDAHLDEIMEFVKPHGPVENILMRRIKGEKTFKGSTFITFDNKKNAEKFVRNDSTKDFKGQDLIKLMQMDYWTKKNQENKEKREAAKALKHAKNKEVRAESKKHLNAPTFIKGIVLRITGLPKESLETSEKGKETIGKLREFFNQYGEVAFIAFTEGEEKVDVRFKSMEENYAAKTWDVAVKAASEGKVKFEDIELQGTVLEGEEEQHYWAEFIKSSLAKKERHNKSVRGGRGGRGRGGGRRRDDREYQSKGKRIVFKDSDEEDESEPPAKKPKDEPIEMVIGAEAKTEDGEA